MEKGNKCPNWKNHTQGTHINCGERLWGPDSEIWICEDCVSKLKPNIKTQTRQDQPTKDGYYWLRIKNEKDTIVCVYDMWMGMDEHEASVCYLGSDMDESLCNITGKWYGPITPPKED